MKSKKLYDNENIKNLFLILTVILGFIFIVSFSTLYVSDAIKNNNACGCVIPIPYMILILSSLGLFVGSITSYFLLSRQLKNQKAYSKGVDFLLNFLEKDEKLIIQSLLSNKGLMSQASLVNKTGLDRVKVHRILEKLKTKGFLVKKPLGKTNSIELCSELNEIFS